MLCGPVGDLRRQGALRQPPETPKRTSLCDSGGHGQERGCHQAIVLLLGVGEEHRVCEEESQGPLREMRSPVLSESELFPKPALRRLGYALCLDMTARDVQDNFKKKGLPWTLTKSSMASCPISVPAQREDL